MPHKDEDVVEEKGLTLNPAPTDEEPAEPPAEEAAPEEEKGLTLNPDFTEETEDQTDVPRSPDPISMVRVEILERCSFDIGSPEGVERVVLDPGDVVTLTDEVAAGFIGNGRAELTKKKVNRK